MTTVLQYNLIHRLKNIFGKRQAPVTEIVTPVKLYRSVHDLPLPIFIDCFCDQKFETLILQGEPTADELNDVWTDIMQQYTELIGGSDVKAKLYNIKQIARLESKLTRIDSLLKLLSVEPTEALFNLLYDFGYDLKKKEYNETNLQLVLKIFLGYYRLDRTKYRMMAASYESKGKVDTKADRNEFQKNLNRVTIAFKIPSMRTTDLLTGQYCNYMNEYAQYCDSLDKQNQKSK
jgi:hypothetical protein